MAASAKKAVATGGLLSQLAKKAPEAAPSKGDTPVVEVSSTPEVKQAVEKLVGAKKQKSQAEATMEQQEEILAPICAEARKKYIQESQKFASTVRIKVKGEDSLPNVNYQTTSKYTVIPIGQQEKIQEAFGDLYEKCFDIITEIAVTPVGMKKIEKEQAEPDGMLAKIIEAVGGVENFEKFFKVTQKLEPTEFLHQQGVMDSKIAKVHEKAIEDGLYKPYKASFRTF